MSDLTRVQQSQPIQITDDSSQVVSVLNSAPIGSESALVVRVIDIAEGSTGSIIPAKAVFVGGTDGANLRGLSVSSAANLTTNPTNNALLVAPLATWNITNLPAVATKATVSKAAGGAGVRHVCTGFIASLAASNTAQTPITCSIRDGATGAGTILWSTAFSAPNNSCFTVTQTELSLMGTANTAMTIEFSAAGVNNSQQTVSLQGYSVQ